MTKGEVVAILCKAFYFTPNVRRLMFEKNLTFSTLLDFYGALLPERQRDALSFYYNDDLSLAEIADEMGISRQGVRDAIKRGEAELSELESALSIASSQTTLKKEIEEIVSQLRSISVDISESNAADKILAISDRIARIADL